MVKLLVFFLGGNPDFWLGCVYDIFKIADLRATLHKDVNFVALTATATNRIKDDICKVLLMPDTNVIHVPTERVNIYYEVAKCRPGDYSAFDPLISLLRVETLKAPKQSGRGGRKHSQAFSLVKEPPVKVADEMKNSESPVGCQCCDICIKCCDCGDCLVRRWESKAFVPIETDFDGDVMMSDEAFPLISIFSEKMVQMLELNLDEYRIFVFEKKRHFYINRRSTLFVLSILSTITTLLS
eukprot:gene992-307_t